MRSISTLGALVTALAALVFTSPASATTLKLDETLDLSQPLSIGPGHAIYQQTPAFSEPASLTLDVGDQLDYTVKFADDKSLSLQNVQYIWGYVGTPTSATVTETGKLELLDAQGNVAFASQEKTATESSNTFGAAFVASDFAGALPTTTTFSGIRYVGTVDSYSAGLTSRVYDTPGFAYFATSAAVGTAIVPEPASVVLLLAGLGCLALRARRAKH